MKSVTLSAPVLAIAALTGTAAATTVDVVYNGLGAYETVTVTSPGYNGNVAAGQLLLTLSNSSDTNAIQNGNYISFCADLYQFTNGGPNSYNVVGVDQLPTSAPMGAAAAQGIANMYAFAAGAQYANDSAWAAAFQIAVWEVANDWSTLDPGTGNFAVTGYSAQAGIYLNQLLAAAFQPGSASIVGLANDTYQDFIVEVPGPASLAVMGLAGLVGRARRRR